MDIIENWNLLNERMKDKDPELIQSLFQIHMGAFDDLRKSGHLLNVNGKPVSALASTLQPQQRLELAGNIGQSLIHLQGEFDLFNRRFSVQLADCYPNCIFIALAAILENLDGALNVRFPDKKMTVVCAYDTTSGNHDPLGQALPLIEKCYPWVIVSTEVHTSAPSAAAPEFKQSNHTGDMQNSEKKSRFWTKLFRK
jgi:hypothetical protein